ncbi:hypothetical protein PCASD_03789 [Puccinia coronata f. sp. avenae]|uniref:Retrotransposon gag domain-containing protein n=1 Tax=Puccinia coronata f. sp. avenae TaxID=200324 RepID=A0A2N5V8H1_9BASI|nr:hypothetical protein PCASD_03789 [Puccinia coronata f. sp. avenae]
MSLPPSPSPHFQPRLGSPVNYLSPSPQPQPPSPQIPSPTPSSHGLPPMSPAPEGFTARPINSETCFGQMFDSNGRLANSNVNDLLAEMRINNKPIVDAVASNTQRIAELQTNSRQHQKDIKELKGLLQLSADVVKIKTTMEQEITQLRADVAHARGVIDALGNNTNACVASLETIASIAKKDNSKVKLNSFERLTGHFPNEKHCILWIAGYFRSANGQMGDWCPSYNWWRGLLGKSAHIQGFDAATGSLSSIFVIEELMTSAAFLSAIECSFSNHKEFEEARKALKALKQKGEPIEQFNITFNSLLYSVDLSDASKCEIYAEAINPEITMAVTLANDVAEVVALERNRAKGITARVEQCLNNALNRANPTPRTTHQPKLSDGTPMDLDAVQANTEFTYSLFKAECIKEGICVKCGGNFDSVHEENGYCPVSPVDQLTLQDKLTMWKNWGGYVRTKKDKTANSTPAATSTLTRHSKASPTAPQDQTGRGKRKESIAAINEGPTLKKRGSEVQVGGFASGAGSGSQEVAGVEMEPMSIGDILFERQLATVEYEEVISLARY